MEALRASVAEAQQARKPGKSGAKKTKAASSGGARRSVAARK